MKKLVLAITSIACIFAACTNDATSTTETKSEQVATKEVGNIISLNGTVSEILVGLGLEQNIVGVDVTSVYPEQLRAKTQMGNAHSYNIESIVASKPAYVIGTKERGLTPENVAQLQQAGINVWVIDQQFTIDGTKQMITAIADTFNKQEIAKEMIATIDKDLASVKTSDKKPKVLFIYARGAGTLNVAGNGTPMTHMIELAGGTPAMGKDFEGFKPLTAESLVAANPDYILLFDSGLKSLEGETGVLAVPGVSATNAGKNKAIIVMDGLSLSGFGPRVGSAVKQLSEKINP